MKHVMWAIPECDGFDILYVYCYIPMTINSAMALPIHAGKKYLQSCIN